MYPSILIKHNLILDSIPLPCSLKDLKLHFQPLEWKYQSNKEQWSFKMYATDKRSMFSYNLLFYSYRRLSVLR